MISAGCRSLEFFFSSRRRHTRSYGDWSSDVCSSDLAQTRQDGADGGPGVRGAAAVPGLVLEAPAALQGRHASLAAQGADGGGNEEQGAALDEDGDGDRLVAVGLERLELVELERPRQGDPGQPVRLEAGRMQG